MKYNVVPKYPDFANEALRHCFIPSPVILKTDCWNEAYEEVPIVPALPRDCIVHCLEINPETCKKAIHRFQFLLAHEGDIRKIPFNDDFFDVVFDFSTIDHIPDYWEALDEYYRVLKVGGLILIVVWLDVYAWSQYQEEQDLHVWYAKADEFLEGFQERFTLMEVVPLFGAVGGEGVLTRFLGRKERRGNKDAS